MAGRKPTPTVALMLNKGKLYGDQKERAENEPQAVALIEPNCPQYFRKSAKEAWRDIAAILKNYNLFLDVNAPFLEVAAIFMADVRNSYWEINRRGKTIKGPGGIVFRNPAIKELNKSTEMLIKLLRELKLSASGITQLGADVVKGKKQKTEMEELLD